MFARVPFHFYSQDLPFSFPLAYTTDMAGLVLMVIRVGFAAALAPQRPAQMPCHRRGLHSQTLNESWRAHAHVEAVLFSVC